jgi:hypothetical protein
VLNIYWVLKFSKCIPSTFAVTAWIIFQIVNKRKYSVNKFQ